MTIDVDDDKDEKKNPAVKDKKKKSTAIKNEIDVDPEVQEERTPLTTQQRRQRAMSMRRNKSKIKAGKRRNKNKKASEDKLKQRAAKKARNLIKDKLSGSRSVTDMSPGEKQQLEKRVNKVSPSRLKAIATKLLPTVRKKEMERLKRNRSPKNEAFEALFNEADSSRFMSESNLSKREEGTSELTDLYLSDTPGEEGSSIKKIMKSASVEEAKESVVELMKAANAFINNNFKSRVR